MKMHVTHNGGGAAMWFHFTQTLRKRIRFFAGIIPIAIFPLFGYPHNGEHFLLEQPDGSQVEVAVFGDEYYQDIESPDGYTLIRDKRNWICYAALSADGREYGATSTILRSQKSEYSIQNKKCNRRRVFSNACREIV
jgi:hypothetical protein